MCCETLSIFHAAVLSAPSFVLWPAKSRDEQHMLSILLLSAWIEVSQDALAYAQESWKV